MTGFRVIVAKPSIKMAMRDAVNNQPSDSIPLPFVFVYRGICRIRIRKSWSYDSYPYIERAHRTVTMWRDFLGMA